MKLIYEILTFPLTVIDNPLLDLIFLSILASISFKVSWNIVGNTEFRGVLGSILHWTIRIITMFVLTTVASFTIKVGLFLYNIPFKIWIILGISSIILVIGILVVRKTISKKQIIKF